MKKEADCSCSAVPGISLRLKNKEPQWTQVTLRFVLKRPSDH